MPFLNSFLCILGINRQQQQQQHQYQQNEILANGFGELGVAQMVHKTDEQTGRWLLLPQRSLIRVRSNIFSGTLIQNIITFRELVTYRQANF